MTQPALVVAGAITNTKPFLGVALPQNEEVAVGTVIDYAQRSKIERHQQWDRIRRAAFLDQYHALHTQGLSQRQAAKPMRLDMDIGVQGKPVRAGTSGASEAWGLICLSVPPVAPILAPVALTC